MGVSQNQNCSKMAKNWPTSRKNTFSTPRLMPRPIANSTCIASTGSKREVRQPGKLPVSDAGTAVNSAEHDAEVEQRVSHHDDRQAKARES